MSRSLQFRGQVWPTLRSRRALATSQYSPDRRSRLPPSIQSHCQGSTRRCGRSLGHLKPICELVLSTLCGSSGPFREIRKPIPGLHSKPRDRLVLPQRWESRYPGFCLLRPDGHEPSRGRPRSRASKPQALFAYIVHKNGSAAQLLFILRKNIEL